MSTCMQTSMTSVHFNYYPIPHHQPLLHYFHRSRNQLPQNHHQSWKLNKIISINNNSLPPKIKNAKLAPIIFHLKKKKKKSLLLISTHNYLVVNIKCFVVGCLGQGPTHEYRSGAPPPPPRTPPLAAASAAPPSFLWSSAAACPPSPESPPASPFSGQRHRTSYRLDHTLHPTYIL